MPLFQKFIHKNKEISVIKSVRFLGVVTDSTLTWERHLLIKFAL
jgi:hypothetical protein